MLELAIVIAGALGFMVFMVWGDDGPLWKNFAMLSGVIAVIAIVIVVGTWVSEYGT